MMMLCLVTKIKGVKMAKKETTQKECALKGAATGALIGVRVGGPVGAVIGGAIGAVVGASSCKDGGEKVSGTCNRN